MHRHWLVHLDIHQIVRRFIILAHLYLREVDRCQLLDRKRLDLAPLLLDVLCVVFDAPDVGQTTELDLGLGALKSILSRVQDVLKLHHLDPLDGGLGLQSLLLPLKVAADLRQVAALVLHMVQIVQQLLLELLTVVIHRLQLRYLDSLLEDLVFHVGHFPNEPCLLVGESSNFGRFRDQVTGRLMQ